MDRRVNIGVGLFLVLGILALGYLSIKLGSAASRSSAPGAIPSWSSSRPSGA